MHFAKCVLQNVFSTKSEPNNTQTARAKQPLSSSKLDPVPSLTRVVIKGVVEYVDEQPSITV